MRVASTTSQQAYGHGAPVRAAVLDHFPSLADAPPVLVTDDVLFRWARNARVSRLLPAMTHVRILEQKIAAHSCRTCKKSAVEIDMAPLNIARQALAECSDEIALLLKQAVGVVKYKVVFRRLQESPIEVIR